MAPPREITKPERLNLRMSDEDRVMLAEVMRALGDENMSVTVRRLVRLKYSELGIGTKRFPQALTVERPGAVGAAQGRGPQ
jgi:hypothetical protein